MSAFSRREETTGIGKTRPVASERGVFVAGLSHSTSSF
jgi:hypothetical protein